MEYWWMVVVQQWWKNIQQHQVPRERRASIKSKTRKFFYLCFSLVCVCMQQRQASGGKGREREKNIVLGAGEGERAFSFIHFPSSQLRSTFTRETLFVLYTHSSCISFGRLNVPCLLAWLLLLSRLLFFLLLVFFPRVFFFLPQSSSIKRKTLLCKVSVALLCCSTLALRVCVKKKLNSDKEREGTTCVCAHIHMTLFPSSLSHEYMHFHIWDKWCMCVCPYNGIWNITIITVFHGFVNSFFFVFSCVCVCVEKRRSSSWEKK